MAYSMDWSKLKDPDKIWEPAPVGYMGYNFTIHQKDDAGNSVLMMMKAEYSAIASGLTVVGVNRITPANIDEVYTRLTMYWNVVGDPISAVIEGERRDFRPEYAHFGDMISLETNLPTLTMARWKSHMATIVEDAARNKMIVDRAAYQRALLDADARAAAS